MLQAAGLLLLAWGVEAANMNGEYMVASGGKFNVPYNTDYASKGHEYFDVWAPEMATHYGEVFWADQGNQPLPQEIVERFKGKVMAITGYEQDQVMVIPTGHPGENPDKDVSVPINWAYNHHYMAWMTGAHSELKKVSADPADPMAHGATTKNIIVDLPSAESRKDTSIPTGQMFSEGNGGESRKSFHGYPKGFAQLIESPTTWHITPMQIDTRNRDCGVTPADVKNCTKFTPGPEPKQTRFGRGIPKDTNYSGILECPCNGRYGGDPMFYPGAQTKIVEHKYTTLSTGNCAIGQSVPDADSCFAAAASLGLNATHVENRTVSNASLPPYCSVTTQKDGSVTVFFNGDAGKAKCNGGNKRSGATQADIGVGLNLDLDASTTFQRSDKGQYCQSNRENVLKVFEMKDGSLDAAYAARNQCEEFCWGEEKCWGCSVDCPSAPIIYSGLLKACQWSAIPSCGRINSWSGSIPGDITEKNAKGGVVTITVSGPADVWFGVGFNASVMADSPYTLVVNSSGVIEQKIGTCGSEAEHCPGDQLASSVKVLSNTVASGKRTVVMTRSFQGQTNKHYTFDLGTPIIPLITAVGSSPVFAYHKSHENAKVALTANGALTCVCDTGIAGKLCEPGGKNCGQFVKNCVHANPALNYTGAESGDLLTQHNPTCNSDQYVGGLSCCHHKRIMLDADQEIRPELLRYHMKWRFWFEEYKADRGDGKPSHSDLPRIYYQTEAHAGEYDIPPAFSLPGQPIPGYGHWPENQPTPGTTCTGTCPNGPDCECVHTITYHWTMSNARLLYAGGHCHAPACISIELYENSTGTPKLLCQQLPHYGTGNVDNDKYDEAGYISLPPCLWSDKAGVPGEENLEPSVFLPKNTPMFSIKKNRNTHLGHYGEMASWQMRGVFFPADSEPEAFV